MQTNVTFYPGQQVVLRSGGPIMTVTHVSRKDGYVDCIWFDSKFGPNRYHTRLSGAVLVPLQVQAILNDGALQEVHVGDVVQLHSGGPSMTVDSVHVDGVTPKTVCLWFDPREMAPLSAGFHPNALAIESR
ncbi:DUF2158 domain-containing protein [Aeromonas sp. NJAU223]|uniref:DUF2158 domain-containing protein n=1 Tax=Aeromonas sp. NJAU223 TaxID=3115650 RepID=UPI003DA8C135